MRKIFTLFILLLLLPVTAGAEGTAPAALYVGGTQINNSGYWKTNTEGKLESGSESDYNVHYDGNGTLTLNGATIQGDNSAIEVPFGAGIYALCSKENPVSLTIELIGTNTITGNYGIYVDAQQGETVGTNASLLIQNSGDDGSLEVSGSSYGIWVKSGTDNASLTINDASVVAKTTQTNSGYAGVCVQSGSDATSSPQLSLAVNGGSLTTSASEGNDGIQFYVGSSEATGDTTNLTVSNNAIVRANGGIKAYHVDEPTPSGTGIVFDGTEGTVYGNVTLDESLTINQGETLTVPEGSSLTVPEDKTITVESGGKLEGTPIGNGTVKIAPTITTESLPEGTVDTAYNQTLTATGDVPITWSLASGSALPNGLNLSEDGKITGTPTAAGQFNFTVTATNDSGSDSKEYTLTIDSKPTVAVTGVTLNKTELALFTGDTATLTATIAPDDATNQNVTWSSDNEAVATVDQNGTVTAVGAGKTTISVTTEDGGKTATCQVTVLHSNLKYFERKEASCTEPGNIEYWYCEGCNKYFSDEAGTTEIKLEDVVIPATGHHYVNGYCTKCGHRDPDYRPDPISYYNIYIEDVCDGVEVSTSKQVVREGGSINVYVKKDTANYTFDNFKVYYKRSYYDTWNELKEGVQPGEYPINNIWTHIYIKAEGAEEKEDPTGIESIEGVKVYTKDGSLYVQTPQREQVIIVSMSGAVVKNEEQIGLKQYHGLQPGIYIVRVGDKAYKVRLN